MFWRNLTNSLPRKAAFMLLPLPLSSSHLVAGYLIVTPSRVYLPLDLSIWLYNNFRMSMQR